jgi:exopolyphosphatase/guanosine-5'-triphosphate,3'-diphosphate pyrophosphatase
MRGMPAMPAPALPMTVDAATSSTSAAPRRNPWRGLLAAVDMGSNSFRLELGQMVRGEYRRIDYQKETVRLGAGLDEHSRLTEESAQRGLACLARFRVRLAGMPLPQVRAVATQTLREATNRNEFLARAQVALGHPIEVISGREEARLIYKGVARLQASEQPRLVIDIGGRSTEMILGQGATPLRAESFQVGSVSLSARYFPGGVFTEAAFRDAQVAAGAELEEALIPFARPHWEEALGSSGTAGAVSEVLAAAGITDGTITPDGLRWCIRACLTAGRMDQLALPGLKPERRAVLGGGLAILYTLAMHFGIDALRPARGALRQGVIFDLDERLAAQRNPAQHDLRDESVAELQQRFEVDLAQAQRVQHTALALFDQVAPQVPSMLGETRRELGWAAALHEIGMMVSHHDHHRHSAYLVGHVDAPGFSQSQQRRLGELVMGQRGGLRKIEESLRADASLAWQVLCLRLAVILCHARADVAPDTAHLSAAASLQGTQAWLGLMPGWGREHPRTLHLLTEETQAWARVASLKLLLAA